jgi:hypothetical protein
MKWQDFVSGPDGAKRLASLEKAVARMKQLDNSPSDSADFRRSWKYWANIHGYLGPDSHFGTVAFQSQRLKNAGLDQFLPYLTGTPSKPGFTDQTPPDAIAKSVWATCQHSPQGQQLNFFGWHRMYLYYFERVLRWAANDQTLTLPYWDYTTPGQTGLPVAFQEPNPGDPVSPLYDWRRSEALNEGLSVLNPDITNIDGPLTTDTTFLQYEGDIERGVHGNVHCSVGQTCPIPVMGLVGVAANDPIFYEHHANIDRMWSCWEHAHPNEQPGDWQNQQFTFVDETGAPVTRPVKAFLDTKALGYVYDNDSVCARAAAPVVMASQGTTPPVPERAYPNVLSTNKRIALLPTSTSVDLSIPAPRLKNLQASAPQRTVLVLRDVSSIAAPNALVNVYVAKKGEPTARKYVATINWFGVFDHAVGMANMDMGAPVARTFQYDVTQQLRLLQLQNTGDLIVTFEAASGLVPSATKKATSNALRAGPPVTIQPDAKLTIGAIELRQ